MPNSLQSEQIICSFLARTKCLLSKRIYYPQKQTGNYPPCRKQRPNSWHKPKKQMIWRALSKFLVNDVITFSRAKQKEKKSQPARKSGKARDRRENREGGEADSVAGHTTYTW